MPAAQVGEEVVAAVAAVVHCLRGSLLWSSSGSASDFHWHGKADARKEVGSRRVDEGGNDADYLAVFVDERTTGTAGVYRCVELNEIFETLAVIERKLSAQTGNDPS